MYPLSGDPIIFLTLPGPQPHIYFPIVDSAEQTLTDANPDTHQYRNDATGLRKSPVSGNSA